MSRYGIIRSEVWTDPAFEKSSELTKLMYFYLLTCDSCNYIGYFRINPSIMAAEMKISEKKILPELLDQKKLWKYDEGTRQILIPTYIKYNPIKGTKQIKGIDGKLKPLKVCTLHKIFLFSLQKYMGKETFADISKEVLVKTREMCNTIDFPTDTVLKELLNEYIEIPTI